MSESTLESSTRTGHWSEGDSLEGVPYERQPKVIVAVQCYETNPQNPDYSYPLPIQYCDITDWLHANTAEQLTILDQIEEALPAGSTNLDDLGEMDQLNDSVSGDHLVGLDELGLPAGTGGTDIHLVSAYVKYLKECRDRRFIPFSDDAGHAERAEAARHEALNTAHDDILSAVGKYTLLAQENAIAAGQQALFSSGLSEEQKKLWEKAHPLVAPVYPKQKVGQS